MKDEKDTIVKETFEAQLDVVRKKFWVPLSMVGLTLFFVSLFANIIQLIDSETVITLIRNLLAAGSIPWLLAIPIFVLLPIPSTYYWYKERAWRKYIEEKQNLPVNEENLTPINRFLSEQKKEIEENNTKTSFPPLAAIKMDIDSIIRLKADGQHGEFTSKIDEIVQNIPNNWGRILLLSTYLEDSSLIIEKLLKSSE
jgi:hypothetical protein